MVRYLFYTIGDLTYQSPLVYLRKKQLRNFKISFAVCLGCARGMLKRLFLITNVSTDNILDLLYCGQQAARELRFEQACLMSLHNKVHFLSDSAS